MKFVSVAKQDLHFEIDGKVFDVPVGGSCEIPDRIAYVIAGRGLPMKPAGEVKAAEPAPASSDEDAASKPAKRGKVAKDEPAPASSDEAKPKKD